MMSSRSEILYEEKQNVPASQKKTQQLIRISILVSIGLALFIFESYIPRPLPWMKPGLANIVTVLALYLYGFRSGLMVTFLRVVIASLILGSFFNPAFLLAIGGGIGATCIMGLLITVWPQQFSVIGVSIAGAFFHNTIQLLLAAIIIIRNMQLFYLLPALMLSSIPTGFIVGIISLFILQRIRDNLPVK